MYSGHLPHPRTVKLEVGTDWGHNRREPRNYMNTDHRRLHSSSLATTFLAVSNRE